MTHCKHRIRTFLGALCLLLGAQPALTEPDFFKDAEFQKASRLVQQSQWKAALPLLEKLDLQYPNQPLIVNELALALFYSDDPHKAAYKLAELFRQHPTLANNYQNLQAIYGYMAATAYAQAVNAIDPVEAPVLLSYTATTKVGPNAPSTAHSARGGTEEKAPSRPPVHLPEATPHAAASAIATTEPNSTPVTDNDLANSDGPTWAPADAATTAELTERLNQFMDAWGRGDLAAYLSFYVPEASPMPGVKYETWKKQRSQRVKPEKQIQLSVANIEAELISTGDTAIMRFRQRYQSKSFQDQVTKQLIWKWHNNQWLISREVTIAYF